MSFSSDQGHSESLLKGDYRPPKPTTLQVGLAILICLPVPLTVLAEPYIDQVLEADETSIGSPQSAADQAAQTGRKLIGTELTLYRESESGRSGGWEQGIGVTWSQETLNHGILSLDASGRYQNSILRNGRQPTRESVLFRQDELPIAAGMTLSIAAGDTLARSNSLLANSYRQKLSSTLVRGLSTVIEDEKRTLTLTSGEIGSLNGFQTSGYINRSGWLTGADYDHLLSDDLRLGLGVWHVENSDRVEDHTTFAGALQLGGQTDDDTHQLHWLGDDQGNLGSWIDSDQQLGRWRHRYGLFWLEPGLLWTDQQIGNDRQGGYWQGDFRSFREALSLGVDYLQTNLDDDPLLIGATNLNMFARYNYQLRRKLSVGGLLSINQQNFSEAGQGYRDTYTLEGFTRFDNRLGTSNLRLTHSLEQASLEDGHLSTLTWDQEWPQLQGNHLRTTLALNRIHEGGDQRTEISWGVLYDRSLSETLTLDADLISNRTQADLANDLRSLDSNLGLLWRLAPALTLRANLNWSRNRTRPLGFPADKTNRRQLFITLQYSGTSGAAPLVLGRNRGKGGSGRISGTVFFDEDRDGVRSPGEKIASNVQLILDGRFRRTTDSNGYFEFWPVHAGEHQLHIAEELLPLPWILSEQMQSQVSVKVRQDTSLEIPLVTITD